MTSEVLYRRLQQHLDRMPVPFPATQSGVEIRILKHLFTPEEALIALELSAIPEPAATIHKRLKTKMALEGLTRALDSMDDKGTILRLPVPGGPLYSKLAFAIGMYERQLKHLTPEFERDARQYMEEKFGEAAFYKKGINQVRVVPVNRSITPERGVATHDDLRSFVESSPGPFAKMACICRHGRDLVGEKCKQTDLRDNCLTIGNAAQWTVNYGVAQFVTKEEMLQLLEAADKEGLVLQPENTQSTNFVCCCCGCCCGVLTTAKRFPRPADGFTCDFYAAVDLDACQSCGACEVRCQMDAISTVEGKVHVDRGRCIGCGLCLTTCPSGALRLEKKDGENLPPDDTKALYIRLLRERYGPLGMVKIMAQKVMGMKI
jgi:Na+-translocating ferredoxin:NAD+ oxidoreductase subunit B